MSENRRKCQRLFTRARSDIYKLLQFRNNLVVSIFLIPWCASWPFSAGSVWCVSCCLDPKAPASSTAPSTAVVWHVCKHTISTKGESAEQNVRQTDHRVLCPCRAETNTVTVMFCSWDWILRDLQFQLWLWDWPWDAACSKGWGSSRVSLVTRVQSLQHKKQLSKSLWGITSSPAWERKCHTVIREIQVHVIYHTGRVHVSTGPRHLHLYSSTTTPTYDVTHIQRAKQVLSFDTFLFLKKYTIFIHPWPA